MLVRIYGPMTWAKKEYELGQTAFGLGKISSPYTLYSHCSFSFVLVCSLLTLSDRSQVYGFLLKKDLPLSSLAQQARRIPDLYRL